MSSQTRMLRKPKIAFIHPSVGKSTGGSQIFVLELAKRLNSRFNVTILSGKKENELCKPVFSVSRAEVMHSNNPLWRMYRDLLKNFISTPHILMEHFTSFLPVLWDLLRNDYDVVFPNNDWGGLLVSEIARKVKGTPILFTEHNGFLDNGNVAARNLKFKPDKYIALSQDFKHWVKNNYPEFSVDCIPNGVDFNRFNPSVKPKKLDLQEPIILCASRNQPNKRLHLVINAVAKLENVSLLMLTSGENVDELNQMGLSKIGAERFRLMSVPYEEMPSYYRACNVFTLPSLYEPFGLVYLEAMACNKPVVAPADPSRIDIVGDGGILCDVENEEVYAEALKVALNQAFGVKPYEQAKKFSWDICANRYAEVIQGLILKEIF